MTTERWEQIAQIYEQVLECEPAARQAFLERACGTDAELRREVDTLLEQEGSPGLMDRPMWQAAAAVLQDAPGVAPGSVLGPYQIDRLVGAGGMGQVYHATDSRLSRSVAIKILPPDVSIDRQLRERFSREAQAGASLTHPHICTLYDVGSHDGVDFIVMEYLSGETLAARLEKGALPLDRALRLAIEIASALDYAHRHGIVHRDVKPANVMLTGGGAKLMDFGVAKLRTPGAADALSTSLTERGTILGTVRYMSPEQIEGSDVDHRSDIFSLGAVIYEMVTGRPPFDGGSSASIMAAILEREPPAMTTVQQLTPPAFDHVVRRCLAKHPDDRWQSAGDVMRELKWVADTANDGSADAAGRDERTTGTRRLVRRMASWRVAAAVLAVALLAVIGRWAPWRTEPIPPIVRFSIDANIGRSLAAGVGSHRRLTISPDGTLLVYSHGSGPSARPLMVQPLNELAARPLQGTDTARTPFFSPDSRWIGYFESTSSELRRIPADGGGAAVICKVAGVVTGASWGDDGHVVFSVDGPGGLMRVSVNGGEPQPLTTPDAARQEVAHQFPSVLPGGRGVVFTVAVAGNDERQIAVVDPASRRVTRLLSGRSAEFVDTGHLVFTTGQTLRAVRFDPERLEITGTPVQVLDDVASARATQGAAQFAISRTGTLVYVPLSAVRFPRTLLVLTDRTGNEMPLEMPQLPYYALRVSPDGERVAVDVREEPFDTWVIGLTRGTLERITSSARNDPFPVWSPDGRYVVTGDGPGLVRRRSDGSGADEALTTSAEVQFPMSFSPDGRYLVFSELKGGHNDLRLLKLDGTGTIEPLPGLQTPASESSADISPDGRWLAYQSNESGQNEIYVRPFPDVSRARVTISQAGGIHPVWSRDGRELFYIDGAGALRAVPVAGNPQTLQPGPPMRLFETSGYVSAIQGRSYDVMPDGRRFLFIKEQTAAPAGPTIVVVLNWREELKQRAAGK